MLSFKISSAFEWETHDNLQLIIANFIRQQECIARNSFEIHSFPVEHVHCNQKSDVPTILSRRLNFDIHKLFSAI